MDFINEINVYLDIHPDYHVTRLCRLVQYPNAVRTVPYASRNDCIISASPPEKKQGEKHVFVFPGIRITIASRVGTGNLAGVATAIAIGGPGAVFWMWVIALLGA